MSLKRCPAGHFFNPPRTTCPICEAEGLKVLPTPQKPVATGRSKLRQLVIAVVGIFFQGRPKTATFGRFGRIRPKEATMSLKRCPGGHFFNPTRTTRATCPCCGAEGLSLIVSF